MPAAGQDPQSAASSLRGAWLLVLGIVLLSLGSPGIAQPSPEPALRERETVRLDCRSEIGRREITLFGNGTVRVRSADVSQETLEDSDLGGSFAPPGERVEMALGELSPEDLERFLARLRRIDLSETEARYGGAIEGDWVGRCRLDLALAGAERSIVFGRFDSLDLALSRTVKMVEELPERVDLETSARPLIPSGYEPRIGDVLERRDGHLFEVVLFTSDGLGVELQGVRQPVSMIVSFDDLEREFMRLVEER